MTITPSRQDGRNRPKLYTLMPLLLAGVMIVASMAMVRTATDADGDGVTDDVELHNERSVHASISSSRLVFDSRSTSDRILFEIDLAVEGLVITPTYYENVTSPGPTDSFVFSLPQLVEYTDGDGDDIYTPGVDPVVSTVIPTGWSFESYEDDSPGTGLHVVEFHAAIGSTGGILGIKAYLGSTFGLSRSRLVTPAALEIDASIAGLTFSPSTELALWLKMTRNGTATLENETEVEQLFSASGDTGIRLGTPTGPRGSVSWADGAFVDSNSTPVPVQHGPVTQSTDGTGTTVHEVYFTIAEGLKVDWSSRVGFDGIVDPDPPFVLPPAIPWETVGLVAVVIITGITAGALAGQYTARRRVEVLKSNKQGDPNSNRGNAPVEKERGITINTSHVEYETKAGARATGSGGEYHRPPSLAADAGAVVHQELHRPPTSRAMPENGTAAGTPERDGPGKTRVNKIEAMVVKQGVIPDASMRVLKGETLSLEEASGLDTLARKLRYGNPLSDDEIDAVGQFLSHNSNAPVDARAVLSRRDSKTALREGLDEVVKVIEKATSGLKDTLKTQV